MTHEEWINRALNVASVTDVGQLEPRTRAALNRLAKKGVLVRDKDWSFPKPATMWFKA